MKEIGKMIKLMDLEDIFIQMEQNMREIGKKTSNMEEARKHGLMELVMKVSIRMGRKMGEGDSNGQMGLLMMDIL